MNLIYVNQKAFNEDMLKSLFKDECIVYDTDSQDHDYQIVLSFNNTTSQPRIDFNLYLGEDTYGFVCSILLNVEDELEYDDDQNRTLIETIRSKIAYLYVVNSDIDIWFDDSTCLEQHNHILTSEVGDGFYLIPLYIKSTEGTIQLHELSVNTLVTSLYPAALINDDNVEFYILNNKGDYINIVYNPESSVVYTNQLVSMVHRGVPPLSNLSRVRYKTKLVESFDGPLLFNTPIELAIDYLKSNIYIPQYTEGGEYMYTPCSYDYFLDMLENIIRENDTLYFAFEINEVKQSFELFYSKDNGIPMIRTIKESDVKDITFDIENIVTKLINESETAIGRWTGNATLEYTYKNTGHPKDMYIVSDSRKAMKVH